MFEPSEILEIAIKKGEKKTQTSIGSLMILGFVAGALIALSSLVLIRVTGTLPKEWGSLNSLLGAIVFPIGLICIVMAGGELVTGNMMSLVVAYMNKRISELKVLKNLSIVFIANLIGSLFVAYAFGHFLGLTEGAFLDKTLHAAQAKVDADFLHALVSGIGCNWFVCLAVWLSFGAKDAIGKLVGVWFPVMIFIATGFQHVVANMFFIPAAIFAGGAITWFEFISNLCAVFLGNLIGGGLFVGAFYYWGYKK